MITTAMTLLGPVDKLAVLTEVERRLGEIKTVDEAAHIRNVAEAARAYAKSAQLGLEIQNHAAFVKIQAERRAGELLARMPRADVSKNAAKTKTAAQSGPPFSDVLKTAGIAATTAKRWQQMAQVPEAVVRKYVDTLDARGYEVTSAGVRRMWKELSGGSLRADADGTVRWSPDESYHWLVDHLDGLLQPGHAARRHLDTIYTRLELENVRGSLVALRRRVDDAIERVRRQIGGEIDAAAEVADAT
jgi:hypothetical protein